MVSIHAGSCVLTCVTSKTDASLVNSGAANIARSKPKGSIQGVEALRTIGPDEELRALVDAKECADDGVNGFRLLVVSARLLVDRPAVLLITRDCKEVEDEV